MSPVRRRRGAESQSKRSWNLARFLSYFIPYSAPGGGYCKQLVGTSFEEVAVDMDLLIRMSTKVQRLVVPRLEDADSVGFGAARKPAVHAQRVSMRAEQRGL